MQIEIENDIFKRGINMVVISEDQNKAYTFKIEKHDLKEYKPAPATEFSRGFGKEFLLAMALMLQRHGYLPQAATDSELKATKYHLEDMRLLVGVLKSR